MFTSIKSFFFLIKVAYYQKLLKSDRQKACNSDMHVYGRHASYLSEKSWTYAQINILQTVLILAYVIGEN